MDCGMMRSVHTAKSPRAYQSAYPRCRPCADKHRITKLRWACSTCGRERMIHPSRLAEKRTAICFECRRQRDKPAHVGSWTRNTGGYLVRGMMGHPLAVPRLVLQHWLVMYERDRTGGSLVLRLRALGFTIHHRNGKRDDNRFENLELLAPGRHPVGWSLETMAAIVDEARQVGLLR